jgi:hypothetical protein
MRRERPRLAAAPAVALAVLVAMLAPACGEDGDGDAVDERQAEVAERGAHVMPFDLEATTHRFAPVPTGLVQTVVADDPAASDQVALVREHLVHEAARFRAGDYGDPARIHGDDMPGLAELEAGAEAIAVAYEDTPDGGRITFATDDPALVDALHRWAEAQMSDHGSHADPATA